MADNPVVPLPANTAIAADDIGGVMYPRTKLSIGADGSASDVSSANPMPSRDSEAKTSIDSVKTSVDALKVGNLVSVTKSDTDLTTAIRALYVGTAGDVTVRSNGQTVVFKNVPAGQWLQGNISRVAAASTAGDFVGVI